MLSSIHPLGERSRQSRWWLTVTAYIVGSTLGGATLGGLLGAAGGLVRRAGLDGPALLALVAVLCGVALASDLRVGGFRLPHVHRQVNEDWLVTYRGWVYGLGFGFQLGLGVVTHITTASVHLTYTLAFLSGSWATGALIGGVFGLARGLVLLAGARIASPEQLRAFHRGIERGFPAARWSAIGALTVAGTASLAVAVAVAVAG